MLRAQLRSLWRAIFRRSQVEQEMSRELRFHIEAHAEDLISHAGLPHSDALRRARLEFGSVEKYRDEGRASLGLRLLDEIRMDSRYALRTLRRSPVFSVAAIVTLAVGIGGNAALFSAVNGLLLRTIPVQDPDSLVRFRHVGRNSMVTNSNDYGVSRGLDGQQVRATFSYPMFQQFLAANRTLADMCACAPYGRVNVIVDGRAEIATAFISSGNFYEAVGVTATLGRTLVPDDDRPSAPPAAVISHRYWRTRFAGDPRVLGTVVRVNNVPLSIVGVLSPTFTGVQRTISEPPDIGMPLALDPQLNPGQTSGVALTRLEPSGRLQQPTHWWLQIMGRLKPGVTFTQVESNFGTVFQQTARAGLDSYLASLPPEERRLSSNQNRTDVPRLAADSGSRGIYDNGWTSDSTHTTWCSFASIPS